MYGPGYPLHEGTNFLGFSYGEIANMETVAEGLDDQSPHSQRSGAVLATTPARHSVQIASACDPPIAKGSAEIALEPAEEQTT